MLPVLIDKSTTVYTPGLLRTSTSSPSWNVEPLVLALLVIAEILVFVIAFVLGKQRSGMATRSLPTGTRNFQIHAGKDVDVLRRPGHNLDKKIRIVVLRPFKFVVN